jgi:UDP-3-O-[3-hydroxymyristoyl] N-acetylglucosamine deacetylase
MAVQSTVARAVEIDGIGLHSGAALRLRIEPAPPNTGRVFVRADLTPPVEIPVRPSSLATAARGRRSTLEAHDAAVHTVEHVLAAAYGCGIDNVRFVISGDEVPDAGDGSAAPFVEALERAGRVHYDVAREPVVLAERVDVTDDGAWVRAEPAETFIVDCTFLHPRVGEQRMALDVTPESFVREVAGARTFGFVEEVEHLRAEGLAQGASLENALVLGPEGPLAGELRFPDECVRHKVLDLIGDCAVLGADLRMRVTSHRAGHRLNAALVQRVAECVRQEGAR